MGTSQNPTQGLKIKNFNKSPVSAGLLLFNINNEFNQTRGGLVYLDILIAKDGATTGKTAIIDDSFPFLDDSKNPPEPRAIFSEHVFRLRVKEGVNPYYIHAFLNSELGQLQLETVTSGGAQGGITKEFVDNIYIPLIDKAAQEKAAKFWVKRINEALELHRRYIDCTEETKKQVDKIIEESPVVAAESL
jgi:hypothetical protein